MDEFLTKLDDDDHDGEEEDDTIVFCNVRSSSSSKGCSPGQSSQAQGAQEREGVNILSGEPVSPIFFKKAFNFVQLEECL